MVQKILPLFILISSITYSQRWLEILESENGNFYDVQNAFYDDWEEGMDKRAYGYKHFKRIENYLQPRVYPTGEIKSFQKLAVQQNKSFTTTNRSNRSANWTSIGPKNWTNYNAGYNPGNGRVNSLVVHPTNSQVKYIATSGGGVWKTSDGGTTWMSLTDDLEILETSDIILDPNNPNTVIFASGDNDSYRRSVGLFKSTDGGATWNNVQPFTSGSNTRVGYLHMDPANSALIYCATNRGMYRSLDTGTTWTKLNSIGLYNIKLEPNDPSVIYATDGGDLLKSTDSGVSFTQISNFPITNGTRLEIETSPLHPNYLYVLVSASDKGFGGFYLTKNGGTTWETMNNNTSYNILGYNTDGSSIGGQGTYDLALEVNPTNPAEVFIGGINVWKSNDTGKTWINLSYWYLPSITTSEYTHADIHYLNFYGSVLHCGSDGGIYTSSDNGFTWNNLSLSLEITEVYDFDMYKSNPDIISLGTQDNGTFVNNSGWININGADGFKSLINQSDPDEILYSVQYGTFYYTNDGGVTKYSFFSDSRSSESGAWESPIASTPYLDTIIIGHNRVWASTDGGNTWDSVTTNALATSSLRNLKMAPSNSSVAYGGDYNELFRLDIDYSTNSSIITDIKSGLPYSSAYIYDILIHPNNDSILWVCFSGTSSGNKVFKSIDAGTNWTNISGTLPNVSANCLAYSNLNEGLFVGMDAGIYYMDTMNSWTSYFVGMPNAVVTKIIVDEVYGRVKASTFGRGVWESDNFYGNTVGIISNELASNDLVLFPNPTAGIVNWDSKEIPESIKIYDPTGKNILEENLNGKTSIDISHLRKGSYFMSFNFKSGNKITKSVIIY